MADLRKVNSGQDLNIPAEAYNAFVDAAIDFQQRKTTTTQGGKTTPNYTVVLVKNVSGLDMPRFSALQLIQPITTDTASAEFYTKLAFQADLPLAGEGKWVVTKDSIPDGEFGYAVALGIVPCFITVSDTSHGFVEVDDLSSTPISADSGSAQIIWKQSGTGDKWAIIKLGGGGSGGGCSDGLRFMVNQRLTDTTNGCDWVRFH